MPSTQIRRKNFNARRILFDTNILMDAMDAARPGCRAARTALRNCGGGNAGDLGMTTAMSLKDAYYLLTKRFGEANARTCIAFLSEQLAILPVSAEECMMSSSSNEPDFEDGLVRAAAELNEVDLILSRDARAFQNCLIRKVTCDEYLDIVTAENQLAHPLPAK